MHQLEIKEFFLTEGRTQNIKLIYTKKKENFHHIEPS